mmetsp:Transcript_49203/g.86602  ORF Transcript_49203/g.86602 Transcript_49203/m.86602 type:complete len:273 (+) Transcript_49203:54-872(+)
MSDALYDQIAAAVEAGEIRDGVSPWDHYEVLGLSRDAPQQDVRKAYKRLALRFHPDKAQAHEQKRAEIIFRVVATAYDVLSDAEKRLRYDAGEGMSFEASIGSPFEIFARTFFEVKNKLDSDTLSADWTLHALRNYAVYSPDEAPEHMHAIVHVGLNYLAKMLDLEKQTVVLLRHMRIDILWVMLAFDVGKELNQHVFAQDGYPITYYDNPLQPGIKPNWSDQNVLGQGRPRDPSLLEAKELSLEDFIERRELARLEQEALEMEERAKLRGG